MKRVYLVRIITLIMILVLSLQTVIPASASSIESPDLTERSELEQKIRYFYQASLNYMERSSFDGYCAMYVNTQLYLLGINREFVAGNGNDEFDNYRYREKSNGGYNIKAYPRTNYTLWSALNAITENGTKDVYNVMVGYQSGPSAASRRYGHTNLIHAIIDGYIYFSDSFEIKMHGKVYPEGSPICCTIQEYCNYYRPWVLDGVVHFKYDEHHVCQGGKTLFQETDHPHRAIYQCSICGQIKKDLNHPGYRKDCSLCNVPDPAKLQVSATYVLEGEKVNLTWQPARLATSYDLYVEQQNNGIYSRVRTIHLGGNEESFNLSLPKGTYRAKLRTWNQNGVWPDGVSIPWAESQWLSFQVVETWDCRNYGHTFVSEDITAPTCTQEGKIMRRCCRCNEIIPEILPPLGHHYGKNVIQTAPKMEKDGLAVCKCKTCGKEQRIVLPSLNQNPFHDVTGTAYYYAPVIWAAEEKITDGMTDTSFGPASGASRAQVVTFLWRSAGSPEPKIELSDCPFRDLEENAYYIDAVLWAAENQIAQGMSDGLFAPNRRVTRGQFVTFLYRMAGMPETDCGIVFEDTRPGAYYEKALLWATRYSVASGMTETEFWPEHTCTRGQIVTFLYRYYNWIEK